MQSHLHFTTVTTALRLLFTILQCSYTTSSSNMPTHLAATALQAPALPGYSAPLSLIDRFRSGENFGGWLQGTDVMLEKKEDCLLGNFRLLFVFFPPNDLDFKFVFVRSDSISFCSYYTSWHHSTVRVLQMHYSKELRIEWMNDCVGWIMLCKIRFVISV